MGGGVTPCPLLPTLSGVILGFLRVSRGGGVSPLLHRTESTHTTQGMGDMMDNTKAVEMADLILRGTKSLTDRMVANDDCEALAALARLLRGFAQALGGTPDINLN